MSGMQCCQKAKDDVKVIGYLYNPHQEHLGQHSNLSIVPFSDAKVSSEKT